MKHDYAPRYKTKRPSRLKRAWLFLSTPDPVAGESILSALAAALATAAVLVLAFTLLVMVAA